MEWTDKQVEYLLRRWREGASAGVIADELKVSRNAVIGQVHRLRKRYGPEVVEHRVPQRGNRGLQVAREPESAPSPPADTSQQQDAASAPRSAPQPKPAQEPEKQRAAQRAPDRKPLRKRAALAALPDPVHVTVAMPPRALINLGKGQCRNPVGEVPGHPGRHVFCAEPVFENTPYCAACALVVFSQMWWDQNEKRRKRAQELAGVVPEAAE